MQSKDIEIAKQVFNMAEYVAKLAYEKAIDEAYIAYHKDIAELNDTTWKITDMHHRPVFIREVEDDDTSVRAYPELARCSDCGKPALVIVYEIKGQQWGWCGVCNIGG